MTDTRAAFEAHFKITLRQFRRHKDGSYLDSITEARWQGWQAAIAASPSIDEGQAKTWLRESLGWNDIPIDLLNQGRTVRVFMTELLAMLNRR